MRVSTGMLHGAILNNIRQAHGRILKMQAEISSGQRIQVPSDDPAGTARALRLRSRLRANAQWDRNLTQARDFALATETTLGRLADLGSEVRVLATRAADSSQGPDELAAFGEHFNSLLENLLSEANAEHGGVRLFGGTDTREAPYVAMRNAEGDIVSVTTRSGAPNEGDLLRQVGAGDVIAINTPGTEVFGDNRESFETLIALRDAARAGDAAAVEGLLSSVDADWERVTTTQAVSGVLIQRIGRFAERLELDAIELEASRSGVEDLDISQALIEYHEEQAMLEASLAMTSRVLELTLARFLS